MSPSTPFSTCALLPITGCYKERHSHCLPLGIEALHGCFNKPASAIRAAVGSEQAPGTDTPRQAH